MTIREIISGFRVPIDKGLPSDDTAFPNAYLYHLMKICRGVLLHEKLKESDYNFKLNLQTLDCIELEVAEQNECCEKIPSGCKWLKSKKPIPGTINNIITSVFNDRGDKYVRVNSESSKSFKRYQDLGNSESNYKYLIKNNHLFVPDLDSPRWVKVEALFYDDYEVKNMCNGDKSSVCDFLDTEFPIDERLIDKMYEMMVKRIVSTYFYFNRDINNNSQNEDSQGAQKTDK
jgi:hypothetical protein